MDAKARGLGHGAHRRDHGPLAVGSGNMDDWRKPVMRVAEPCQQIAGAVQPQVDQFRVKGGKPL